MDKYRSSVRRALKIVLERNHPKLKISTGALKIIEKLFVDLNRELIDSCLNLAPATHKGSNMNVHIAHEAVKSTIPGRLGDFACNSANQCIVKYEVGILNYKLQRKTKTKRKPDKSMPPAAFSKSVLVLADLVDPEMKVHVEAKKLVASILQQMCQVVVSKASQTAEVEQMLTVHDIIKAVDFCMTPSMARMAIAEGTRNTMLYLNGITTYSEKDFPRQRKKVD